MYRTHMAQPGRDAAREGGGFGFERLIVWDVRLGHADWKKQCGNYFDRRYGDDMVMVLGGGFNTMHSTDRRPMDSTEGIVRQVFANTMECYGYA